MSDIKRLRDMLELKSYEAQEWREKYESVLKSREPRGVMEQEYRKLKQVYELKVIENEELKRARQSSQIQSQDISNEADVRRLKHLLEMRTAECEDWRRRCLAREREQGQVQSSSDPNARKMVEAKERECEEWKSKYAALAKNKDRGASQAIDDLQFELKKVQRMHEMKHLELQEAQPKLHKAEVADKLELELRRVK